MNVQIQNKETDKVEEELAGKNNWTLIFIVTTFTVVFAFAIILFFPNKDNLILSLRTAVATMLIGLGLIYTFKVKEARLEIDYRALFFISLLFLGYGFIFGNLAVWGFSTLFLLVSLINVKSWKNEQKWFELSEEVKKVKLVIIFTIILLFFVSIVLLYLSNKIETYQAKVKANFITLSSHPALNLKKEYVNKDYGFILTYPKEYLSDSNLQYQYVTHNTLVEVVLPEKDFSGTNLGEALLIVGASRDKEIIASCLNAVPGEEKQAETKIIKGTEYSVFEALDAAAGNHYESTSYRTVKNSVCYEVVELLHWAEISNYPPGAVKEFDRNKILLKLEEILNTFKIM